MRAAVSLPFFRALSLTLTHATSLLPALMQVAVSADYDTKTFLLTISVRYSGAAISPEEFVLFHPSQYQRLVSGGAPWPFSP